MARDGLDSTTAAGASPDSTSRPPMPPTEEQVQKLKAQLEQQQQQPATVADAWKSIKPDDFFSVHQTPCARQGFLAGIGAGAGVGFLRFVMGAPVPRAANWAAGVGMAGAVAQYEFCQYRRRQEKHKIKRVVEVYDRKQAEAARQKEEAERARREREEAERLKAQKRWYKFW